jgi:hypothetical protein
LLALSGVSQVAMEFRTAEEAQAHFRRHSDDNVSEPGDEDDDFEE